MNPICFMVMPFGKKSVANAPAGVPVTIDFDDLWENAYEPALKELGYDTVRADQDSGALIIHEMLERLFFSDLVVADMTIPNGNVYYEVGIRHASKQSGCVLISADWATPLFDTSQMRRIGFTLDNSPVSDTNAEVIKRTLVTGIPMMRDGESPMYTVLPGYPTPDQERATTMKTELRKWSSFQTTLRALSLESDKEKIQQGAEDLISQYKSSPAKWPSGYAIALLMFLRDSIGWSKMLEFIELLPTELQDSPLVKEQGALAMSKIGNETESIAAVELLMKISGESSERQGIIGGRYKRLAAKDEENGNDSRASRNLLKSIAAYERGTALDLADFYCVSNLARLYRQRAAQGDEQRASSASRVTVMACEIALERDPRNEWVRPTLLSAAFDSGDLALATKWCDEVIREGSVLWKLETTIIDLEKSVSLADESIRDDLEKLVTRLENSTN